MKLLMELIEKEKIILVIKSVKEKGNPDHKKEYVLGKQNGEITLVEGSKGCSYTGVDTKGLTVERALELVCQGMAE